MTDIATQLRWLTGALMHAFERLFDATSDRLGAPYLLGAIGLAIGVWFMGARRGTGLLSFLFPKAIWWHRSARLDYALLITRTLLDVTLLSALAISTTAVSFAVARFLWRHVGILPSYDINPGFIIAGFSISAFLAEDLVRYALHRAAHRIDALWELHKLHHSAEVLTPFTIFRVHPLEGLLNASSAALVVGVLGGLVSWMFPGKLAVWTISGTYALAYVWNLLGTNLRHSHVWLSYGPALEHLLISPAQHQIHHSTDPRHHDRNYGSALAVWDWLFNSLYVTRGRERLEFGLAAHEQNHESNVTSALIAPLRAAGGRLFPARPRTVFQRSAGASGTLPGHAEMRLRFASRVLPWLVLVQRRVGSNHAVPGRIAAASIPASASTTAGRSLPGSRPDAHG